MSDAQIGRTTAQIVVEHKQLDAGNIGRILGVEPSKVVAARSEKHKGRFKIRLEGGTPVGAPFLLDELVNRLLDRVPRDAEPWQRLRDSGHSVRLWLRCELEPLLTFSFELKAPTVARLAPLRPQLVVVLERCDEENGAANSLTHVGEVALLVRNEDGDKSRCEKFALPDENPNLELHERTRAFLEANPPIAGDCEVRFSFTACHMSRRVVLPAPLVESLGGRSLNVGFWFYDWEE